MNIASADAILQYVLYAASDEDGRGRALTTTHLVKYAYLADLIAAQFGQGETFTKARWVFYHFGPWSQQIQERIEPALLAIGATSKPVAGPHEGTIWFGPDRSKREEVERKIPLAIRGRLKHLVHEFGSDTAGLLHYVYGTPPMRRARPREELDLAIVARPEREEEETPESEEIPFLQLSPAKRKRKLRELRKKFQEITARKAESKRLIPPLVQPIYDEVFFKGVEWLDSLAGDPIRGSSGTLVFSDDVWDSDARTEPELP